MSDIFINLDDYVKTVLRLKAGLRNLNKHKDPIVRELAQSLNSDVQVLYDNLAVNGHIENP